eukprot:1229586-Amphidinium_carterae.1
MPSHKRLKQVLYAGQVKGRTVLWCAQALGSSAACTLSSLGLLVQRGTLQELDGHANSDPEEIWICHETIGFPCADTLDNEHDWSSGAVRALTYAIHHTPGVEQKASSWSYPVIIDEHEQEDAAADEESDEGEEVPSWQPNGAERQAIQQAHDNSGHPQLRRFLRLLRQGGVKKEVLQWVSKSFSCEQCLRASRPSTLTQVHVPGTHRFNCITAADTVMLPNQYSGENEPWLHIVCLGTGYQIMERVHNREPSETWRAYSVAWRRYFGEPDVMVVDAGTEFQSPFSELLGQTGVLLHVTSQESPWENGACERSHREIRRQLEIMKAEWVPTNDSEWLAMVATAVSVRNSAPGVKGFSAIQRVLGRQPRIAGSLTSDSWLDAVYEGPMESIQKSADMRYIAQKAHVEQQHRDRLLLASRGRHRIAQNPVTVGQRVWVWRSPLRGRASGWYGPGVVVTAAANGTAFVHIRGSLWRVPLGHLRHQSSDDRQGWDLVQRFLSDLRHQHAAEQPLRRKFVDCSKEPPPMEEHPSERADHVAVAQSSETAEQTANDIPPGDPEGGAESEYAPTEVVESAEEEDAAIVPRGHDVWRQVGSSAWIRYHRQVRSHLFVPQGGMLERLTAGGFINRKTVIIREYQDPYYVSDRWQEVGARETPFRWVGKTIFERSDPKSREPPEVEEPPARRARQVSFVGPVTTDHGITKGIVDVRKLPTQGHKDLFLKGSRVKEDESMAKVLTAVDDQTADKILADPNNVVVPARWLDVFKQVDESDAPVFSQALGIPKGLVPKSRLIIQGFHDKDLLSLNRSVPAAEQHELLFVLEVIADMNWQGFAGDVQAAFTQAAKTPVAENDRGHPVYALLPSEGVPGLTGVKLARLEVEGYGLTTGPLSWRNALYGTCRDRGMLQHPLGPCTLLSYNTQSNKLQGILLVQVDDLLGGGEGAEWETLIQDLRQTNDFGKWKHLSEGVEFNGRYVEQREPGRIIVSMQSYVSKIKEVPVKIKTTLGEDTVKLFRGLLGALSWASRCGAPQAVAEASMLASKVTQLTWQDVKEGNASLRRLKSNVCELVIHQMSNEKILICYADASLGNHEDHRTQIGYVMGWVEKKSIMESGRSPFSIQEWGSHKYRRVVSSTLATEASALFEALASAEWLWHWNQITYNIGFEMKRDQSRKIELIPLAKSQMPQRNEMLMITDSKSVFDVLDKGVISTSMDRRAGLELQVILDTLKMYKASCRWVPHHANIADALTKMNGYTTSLLNALRNAEVAIVDEAREMQMRKEQKQATGTAIPRPKGQQKWHGDWNTDGNTRFHQEGTK